MCFMSGRVAVCAMLKKAFAKHDLYALRVLCGQWDYTTVILQRHALQVGLVYQSCGVSIATNAPMQLLLLLFVFYV